jgi:hypothetical protein
LKDLKLLIFFLFVLGFAGCGKSPLLNHTNESKATTGVPDSVSQNATGACDISWSTACAQIIWDLGPTVGENKFHLNFNTNVSNLSFSVSADMPEMGHGTSPATWSRAMTSEISISKLWLVMSGRWIIRLNLGGEERDLEVML